MHIVKLLQTRLIETDGNVGGFCLLTYLQIGVHGLLQICIWNAVQLWGLHFNIVLHQQEAFLYMIQVFNISRVLKLKNKMTIEQQKIPLQYALLKKSCQLKSFQVSIMFLPFA